MIELSEGALDAIMAGDTIENPVFQILGHKKLSSSVTGERFRLLVSDGVRINSFTMLATQLNHMIGTVLTEFTVVQVNRYAISTVNTSGKPKKVMVILSIDVKVPGASVGGKIGNPTQLEQPSENTKANPNISENKPQIKPQNKPASVVRQTNAVQRKRLDESISAGSDITTTPIAALSPYQNRWVIKARVSNKSPIRTWSNSRGEGKVFSIDLVDESGEIRCTAFREQCDKFYDMIEIGKVYYISRCTFKTANKQFTHLKNEYEMTMTNDTEIVACHDEVDDIPPITYEFQPLSVVESKEKNDIIDVLAIVKSYDEVQSLTARSSGRELRKRDVHLVDMSNVQVVLTLWGTQAEEFHPEDNPVIAIKSVRISEFQDCKSLSTIGSSMLVFDPDLPEAHRLRGWYNTTGKLQDCKVLSRTGGGGGMNGPLLTVLEGTKKSLASDSGEIYIVKGFVSLVRKDNAVYKSCPSDGCKKKLIDLNNDMYKCEKCNREYPNFKYRLLTLLTIIDWTGNMGASAFSEEAEKLIGRSADELGELKENNTVEYDDVFSRAVFQDHFFKIKARKETYNDEMRLRSVIIGVAPVDRKMYHNYLMEEIKRFYNVRIN